MQKNNLAARAGRWSAHHRKRAILGWIAFVIFATVLGGAVGQRMLADEDSGNGESRAELQRLRTLRELTDGYGISLSDLAFAVRQRREPGLRRATDAWLDARAVRPADLSAADWLRLEQEKHQRLLEGREPLPIP